MDDIWERAVETALNGQTDYAATRTLTLDGAVKAMPGRLPPPSLLEKFDKLQHLSIANNGVPSLEHFPRLRNLQKLILSDNRIAGGLEYLVEAGLESLRDLDLSNNRIQYVEDLAPLAQLKLVSLDLYECPVTRVKDYRSRVFGLIKSLKYLDKMDADENERPDSDEEEEEEEEGEDEDEEDPGNEEIDCQDDRRYRLNNGHREGAEEIIEVNDDEESDADEEKMERSRERNGHRHQANGFRVEEVRRDAVEEEEEESDSGEEVDDDDVVEVHEIEDSDDEDEDEDEEDDDEEEVDNDEGEFAEQGINRQLTSMEGEIDGHEQGEDDEDDDDIGETGEEEQGVDAGEFEDEEEGEEEDDDFGEGYLIQPGKQAEEHDGGSDMDSGNEEEDTEEEEVDNEDDIQVLPSSSHIKRKRGDDDDDDEAEDEESSDEDVVNYNKSSKKHC